MRFAVVSLGCAKNQVDLEWLVGALTGAGLVFEPSTDQADLILVNTCAFIAAAREEAVDTILAFARQKRERCPGLLLAVAGCLVQRYGDEVRRSLPEVDFWVTGPGDKAGLRRMLRSVAATAASAAASGPPVRDLLLGEPGSAFLKISEGCDNRCSYCSIPLIKGSLCSRPLPALRRDARELARLKVKEVVVVAQDTTAWGRDLPGSPGLVEVLEALLDLPFRFVRLMYAYPMRLPERVERLMATEPRLCPYLDIPFQHADPRVLEAMGRRGDGATYLREIERLRAAIPGLVLRTTLLVGHPGEDRRAFARLVQFVRRARFEWLGAFAFSPEEGTPSGPRRDRARPATALRRQDEVLAEFRAARETTAFGLGRSKDVLVIEDVDDVLLCRSATEAPEVDGVILARAPRGGTIRRPRPGEVARLRLLAEDGLDFTGSLVRA